MSKYYIEKITCPNCSNEFEFKIWESVNTMLDPEMKSKVKSGEIFEYICSNCVYTSIVDYPTLYHQMEDKVMIYYAPGENSEVVELIKGSGNRIDLENELTKDYKNRVVSTINELKEKIFILDEDLDDRVIEIMKFYLYNHVIKENPDFEIEEILLGKLEDGGRVFYINFGNNKWGRMDFNQEIYHTVEANFRKLLENDKEVVIDINWAIELIRKFVK